MRKLGISIYMDKNNTEEILEYIDKAASYGFKRIFSCLLSVEQDKEKIKNKFYSVNTYAKNKGFEIIVDVNANVFQALGITYDDMSFFKEINADGIRLDRGFSGKEESIMTFNPHNLKIEINMSNLTHHIDTIMDYMPNTDNLIGSHNFYPHEFTAMPLDHFNKCTENFKKYGLRTAAFVSSQAQGAFGPWPTTEGLPSLEMHRFMSLKSQIKHLISLNNIDDIIISNCYPTDDELNSIKNINLQMVNFDVILNENIPDIERKIVLDELHFSRGDINEFMIRSTQSRVKYHGHHFELFNAPDIIHKGDILIESTLYGHHAGELQVALKDMKNSGKTNVVGRIVDDEIFILDYIKPWQKFKFTLF